MRSCVVNDLANLSDVQEANKLVGQHLQFALFYFCVVVVCFFFFVFFFVFFFGGGGGWFGPVWY